MTICDDITRIFDELTFTSQFEYKESISINKKTKISTTNNNTIVSVGDYGEYTFSNVKYKIEVFKNRIDVYTLTKKYFYKHNPMQDIKIYEPMQGFILNKHVIKTQPHHMFDLNTTNMIYFTDVSYFNFYFVFDIEDKRETYADALNQIVNQSLPLEMVENIANYLGCDVPTQNDIYNKSHFPFNFVSKYTQSMPTGFIKEQLFELYEMGVIKIAYRNSYDVHPNINILTDESYDYVFPNFQPNKITKMFPSKNHMHDFIDDILERFFNE
jgi:hypothetical protein